jgi:hypothetical protein
MLGTSGLQGNTQWITFLAGTGAIVLTVRGNHDHAAGFSVDPQCSAPFKKLAEDLLRFTQSASQIE